MKTTVELPDELLQRAKVEAAKCGITLKQILTDALEEWLRRGAGAGPAWREHAGALRDLRRETRQIERRIAEEFEVIGNDE